MSAGSPIGGEPPRLLIGLMSGTSLDGVDGVLARWPGQSGGRPLDVLAHRHRPLPDSLRDELLALNTPGNNELHRAALAANALAHLQADVVADLLTATGTPARDVAAVGSHGQTVRHRPGEFDGTGYTCQLNNGALLAERCGIPVACDFRSRDVAAGGQGAPLVPAFHARVFGGGPAGRAVLNLGGIANLTLLPADDSDSSPVTGFDCGPANALLDHWMLQHQGRPYDADGAWGAGGRVLPALLAELMAEPFLAAPPPKSTGRDLFNPRWLAGRLANAAGPEPWIARDVQATLAEFTAQAAAQSLQRHMAGCPELLVCGGGALNGDLMRRLQRALPACRVSSTGEHGLPPLEVEAAAFAWLAGALLCGLPGNRPDVTGAAGLRVLGALYPA